MTTSLHTLIYHHSIHSQMHQHTLTHYTSITMLPPNYNLSYYTITRHIQHTHSPLNITSVLKAQLWVIGRCMAIVTNHFIKVQERYWRWIVDLSIPKNTQYKQSPLCVCSINYCNFYTHRLYTPYSVPAPLLESVVTPAFSVQYHSNTWPLLNSQQ